MRVYRCSHLRTPEGYVDGAVAVRRGVIVCAGAHREVRRECAGQPLLDLGRAIVLPGLVNAHTHLELSWMGHDKPAGGDYLTWLRGLLERRTEEVFATVRAAADAAAESMLARGTVAAGDVCNDNWIADVWDGKPARGVLFHEILGLDRAQWRIAEGRRRIEARPAPPGWRWSLVPHAPHTTSFELLRGLADAMRAAGVCCSIHVAESAGEAALLEHGKGALREFFETRGFLEPDAAPAGCRPLERVAAAGLLTPDTLVVHAVHLNPGEIERLGASGATVVTCPRSNAYLGVGTAPVPELVAAGAGLALGTDSLASAPDLDLFAEMTALRRIHPTLAPSVIVRAATRGGADALGLGAELGSIETGKSGLLTVVPFDGHGDPDEFLCSLPERVYPLARAPHEVRA